MFISRTLESDSSKARPRVEASPGQAQCGPGEQVPSSCITVLQHLSSGTKGNRCSRKQLRD